MRGYPPSALARLAALPLLGLLWLVRPRPAPEPKEYYDVLAALRVAIDDLRGVYRNVGESEAQQGHYPVSPLLDIYDGVAALQAFGQLAPEEAAARRALSQLLFAQWKNVRGVLLYELDRPEPSASDIRRMMPDAQRTISTPSL